MCRHHAALADLGRLLLRLPVPVHLVVLLQDRRHAPLQLHVCADGHLQLGPPHRPLPLPVPVLPGGHPPRRHLHPVRHTQDSGASLTGGRTVVCRVIVEHTVARDTVTQRGGKSLEH